MTKTKFTEAVAAVLSGQDVDQVADKLLADTLTPPEPKAPKIGEVIATLVMDATLSYDAIVETIHQQFKACNTSARSVASIAARLRKTGVDVPHRRAKKVVTE